MITNGGGGGATCLLFGGEKTRRVGRMFHERRSVPPAAGVSRSSFALRGRPYLASRNSPRLIVTTNSL